MAHTVASALMCRLERTEKTTDIPVIGQLIQSLPIAEGHDELVEVWRRITARLGFGAPTYGQEAYRQHWLDFVQAVEDSVVAQKPV